MRSIKSMISRVEVTMMLVKMMQTNKLIFGSDGLILYNEFYVDGFNRPLQMYQIMLSLM